MNRWFNNLPIIGNLISGKIVLSFLMLLFAIFMQVFIKNLENVFCIFAMLFSFLGDIALNHKQNHDEQTKKDFIIGGISFILAHVFYCIAYFTKIKINCYSLWNFGAIFAITILIVFTVIIFITANSMKPLFLFGILYLWLTGINYVAIFSYSYSVKSLESIAALGGFMFLTSDIIIGLENFSGLKSKLARELVWWLYPIGQIILISIA